MAYVVELPGRSGVDGDEDTAERPWRCFGYSDEIAALTAVAAAAPSEVNGIPFRNFSYDEEFGPGAGGIWDVTAHYAFRGDRPEQAVDTSEFEFNFQAPSVHFDRSLETISTFGESSVTVVTAGGTTSVSFAAEDFGGLINVRRNGGEMQVEGVDLPSPPETFSIRYSPSNANVTAAYLAHLYRICGRVNDDAVSLTIPGVSGTLNFAQGELLLTRCNASIRDGDSWSFNFGFAYAPNLTNIPVGNMTVTAKEGWHYLWAYYEDVADNASTSKMSVARPVSAYVERVFEYDDFTLLGITS